ncbi:MAG: hypothetical protein PHE17_02390 [Thiothrix sp.]|uniref:hypothetical protein n=1 Tax=Thiothrix sp. TaxID=1032 RepID=UPI002621E04A|nr:hypothetical protein [Thiothrix sp.]MDD5391848.1 hypothetical protein [Thiothrix sp.]
MKIYPIILAVICLLPTASFAEGAFEVGVSGAKIGDLGNSNGLEAGYRITPTLRVRGGYSTLDYKQDRTFSTGQIKFTEQLKQKNARFTLDWFPWQDKNGFYGSAGITHLGDPSTLSATVTPTPGVGYSLNGKQYAAADLGNITGAVETKKTLPYVGVGYNHCFGKKSGNGWYIQAEAGQVSGLSSQIKMQSSNPNNWSSLPADLQAYADQESTKLKNSYTLYGITIGYRF